MNASPITGSRLRSGTAAIAGLIAALYLLIGTEVVRVPAVAEVEPGPAVPLVLAGAAFAVLAAGLALRPGRAVHLAGALLCLLTIAGYLVVAPDRDPSFEPWGLSLKALQVLLLALLVHTAARPAPRTLPAALRPTARRSEHTGRS